MPSLRWGRCGRRPCHTHWRMPSRCLETPTARRAVRGTSHCIEHRCERKNMTRCNGGVPKSKDKKLNLAITQFQLHPFGATCCACEVQGHRQVRRKKSDAKRSGQAEPVRRPGRQAPGKEGSTEKSKLRRTKKSKDPKKPKKAKKSKMAEKSKKSNLKEVKEAKEVKEVEDKT